MNSSGFCRQYSPDQNKDDHELIKVMQRAMVP
jgi:hypothetical protein